MQRVFLTREQFAGDRVTLPPEVAHYLKVVLRLHTGEEFIALDGAGAQYRVRLSEVEGLPGGEIIEALPVQEQPGIRLTLYQGLPKGKRFPLIIQKCTELGLTRLVPMLTARSQVRLGEREIVSKGERWGKIALEAAEQCQRTEVPQITPALDFGAAIDDWRAAGQPGLLLDETLAGEANRGLRQTLAELGKPPTLSIFIGPEGGFAPLESQLARTAGLLPVSLGSRILRTETAAIVACALVMYEYGELG